MREQGKHMIIIDLVCPTGGLYGGVENVIKSWTKNIDSTKYRLRVIHMSPGIRYLEGYRDAYYIDLPEESVDYPRVVAGYELFLRENGAPDICIATNWPMMVKACDTVRKRRGDSYRLLSWLHTGIEVYQENGKGGLDELILADAHLAINGRIREELIQKDPGAVVYLIGNPVDLQEISRETPDPHMLVYVGRLNLMKHVDVILESIYRAKGDWKLKIIGDGELKNEVKKWISTLGLQERVTMYGWQDNPWQLCEDASMLVMASEYEGFGMTAFEASSMGLTVLSTPVDGIADYIVPGENGYLYSLEEEDGLVNLLNELEEKKKWICDKEKCRESVMPYESSNYFQTLHRIFHQILEPDKISVIVPCYNVKEYVGRCIDSLLAQTIGKEHMEIILVNDASGDDTLSVLMEYESRFPEQIMVIDLPENMRQGGARNIGFSYATGRYIGFVDSDDWVEPDMYEKLLCVLQRENCQIVCSHHTRDAQFCLHEKRELGSYDVIHIDSEDKRGQFLLFQPMKLFVWDKLYKKSFLENHGISFPEHLAYEDILYGMLLHMYASKIAILKEPLYHYFINWDSTVLKKDTDYMDDFFVVNEMKLQILQETGFYQRFEEVLEYDYVMGYYIAGLKLLALRYSGNCIPMIRKMQKHIRTLFPNVQKNPYIPTCAAEIYQLAIEMIAVNTSDEELTQMFEAVKKHFGS